MSVNTFYPPLTVVDPFIDALNPSLLGHQGHGKLRSEKASHNGLHDPTHGATARRSGLCPAHPRVLAALGFCSAYLAGKLI